MKMTTVIDTRMTAEPKGLEIMRSVLGQLSDGIWENSYKCYGYWWWANIVETIGNIGIEVETDLHYAPKNPYAFMSQSEIIEYFANKIHQILYTEAKDNATQIKKCLSDKSEYVSYNEDITFEYAENFRKEMLKKWRTK